MNYNLLKEDINYRSDLWRFISGSTKFTLDQINISKKRYQLSINSILVDESTEYKDNEIEISNKLSSKLEDHYDELDKVLDSISNNEKSIRLLKSSYEPLNIKIDKSDNNSEIYFSNKIHIDVADNIQRDIILYDIENNISTIDRISITLGLHSKSNLIYFSNYNENIKRFRYLYYNLNKSSTLNIYSINYNDYLSRIVHTTLFTDIDSTLTFNGCSALFNKGYIESRFKIEHNKAKCVSKIYQDNLLLNKDSKSVWYGNINISKEAKAIDTYEYNSNLILTSGAESESIPNLSILTGDIIGAGHGSITHKYDDIEMFYFNIRCIDRDNAIKAIIEGYISKTLKNIENSHLTLVERIKEYLYKYISNI